MAKKRVVKVTSPISPSVRKRLKKLPGKSRRYVDPKTKKTYSRRQYEKNRNDKKPRKNGAEISRKYSKYVTIRDIYISSQRKKGRVISKSMARDSPKFKKLYADLHTKDTADKNNSGKIKRQKAWEGLTGGKKEEWTPYVQRWVKGDL